MRLRHFFLLILLTGLLPLLLACGAAPASQAADPADFEQAAANQTEVHQDGDDGHDHGHLEPGEISGEMQVVVVPTELVVGPDRFAVGLFDPEQNLILDAEVHFHYYDLSDPDKAVLELEADAHRVQTPDGLTTIFAHQRDFERAGNYGVEVEARMPDGTAARQRIGFRVVANPDSVSPGDSVAGLKTPTLADVEGDLSLISSASQPNPAFYELGLPEAISNGKPTVLLIATPEFCQTRLCGPVYGAFENLYERYGQQANFIHLEDFGGLPAPAFYGFKLSPAVEAFGVESDPWVYLIDEQGTVVYRLEGLFTEAEVEEQMQARLDL